MTRYLCTIGTTNGSQNVIDDFVEANSEAEAIGEMKKSTLKQTGQFIAG